MASKGISVYDFINTEQFLKYGYHILKNQTEHTVSNAIKYRVYQDVFDIVPRPKYTGFEGIDPQTDQFYRALAKTHLIGKCPHDDSVHFEKFIEEEISSDGLTTDPSETKKQELRNAYRQNLVDKAIQTSKKCNGREVLLYFSGGADSEVMVRSFMASGVPFRVVTFLLTVEDSRVYRHQSLDFQIPAFLKSHVPPGETVINYHDVKYAVNFVQNSPGVNQTFRIFNVLDFWESSTFLRMAETERLNSPQLLTQRLMPNLIEQEVSTFGQDSLNTHPVMYYSLTS